MTHNSAWWHGGVIYQIYPRSFQDSNADGIGDLPGITRRLPYLKQLGVDALWLSPFFKSPMKDFGYDISDYCAVDPMFGTLGDFDAMVQQAHGLGLKIMIDQVLSHCSDQHPWFVESRASRSNARADWFVWADPKPDGTPPNNWHSIFGGSAWQWDTRRQQYYLHNFLSSQPDLNFHNPQVQQAALDCIRFWLERGVNGVRLDVVNFYFHDAQLRDNPARDPGAYDPAVNQVNPYAWQRHLYDKSQPENLDFLRRLRQLLNQYPDTSSVGEIGDDNSLERIAEYTGGGDKLHMAYGFDLLGPLCSARYIHDVIARFESTVTDGWACWSVSNHDVARVASRWQAAPGADQDAWLRLVCALQLSLRGTVCIYQGDELGLTEVDIAFEDLQDPYGITMWPEFKGRDGCRTPMVWDASARHAGFSEASTTWLPVAPEHLPLAALTQVSDASSLYSFYSAMLSWRRLHPVLRRGAMSLLPADDAVLAFVRSDTSQTPASMLCVFNLSAQAVRYALPAKQSGWVLDSQHPLAATARLEQQHLLLQPYAVAFATPQN
jgi:alpha-glucosidase